MSVRVMAWVWDHAPVDASELGVLLVIADHADDDGSNAWPSVDTIARKTRRKARRVQQIIRQLEQRGVIRVEGQRGGTPEMRSDRRPNRYSIMIDGVQGSAPRCPAGVQPSAPRDAMDGVQDSAPGEGRGVQPSAPRDAMDGVQPTAPPEGHGVQPMVERGATHGRHGVQPTAPNSSWNHPEPLRPASPAAGEQHPRSDADEISDALAAALGHSPASRSERGAWNRAVADLRDAGATPSDIRQRCRRWPAAYPAARLTASALARHWGELAMPAGSTRAMSSRPCCDECASTGWITRPDGVARCPSCADRLVEVP